MIEVLDKMIFLRLYQLATEHPWLGETMVAVTNASSIVFAGVYGLLLLTLLRNRDRKILFALLGPLSAFSLVYGIRMIYHRPRPFIALDIDSLIAHEASASMPSQHAASAFAIAMALYYTNKKLGIPALILAAVTALSRPMVGVHFPLDILAGALLSVGILYGLHRFFVNRNVLR